MSKRFITTKSTQYYNKFDSREINLESLLNLSHDLITSEILNQLPEKAILLFTYIFNSVLKTTHFTSLWKYSIAKMILKPSKPSYLPSSYRPISLLPILGRVLEKLLLHRIHPILDSPQIIPDHQFCFREQNSTIQQCHSLVDTMAITLEQKQNCWVAFLDEAQAFNWVDDPSIYLLPNPYNVSLQSIFLCQSRVRPVVLSPNQSRSPSSKHPCSLLDSMYTADIPQHPDTT